MREIDSSEESGTLSGRQSMEVENGGGSGVDEADAAEAAAAATGSEEMREAKRKSRRKRGAKHSRGAEEDGGEGWKKLERGRRSEYILRGCREWKLPAEERGKRGFREEGKSVSENSTPRKTQSVKTHATPGTQRKQKIVDTGS